MYLETLSAVLKVCPESFSHQDKKKNIPCVNIVGIKKYLMIFSNLGCWKLRVLSVSCKTQAKY